MEWATRRDRIDARFRIFIGAFAAARGGRAQCANAPPAARQSAGEQRSGRNLALSSEHTAARQGEGGCSCACAPLVAAPRIVAMLLALIRHGLRHLAVAHGTPGLFQFLSGLIGLKIIIDLVNCPIPGAINSGGERKKERKEKKKKETDTYGNGKIM